MKLTYFCFEGTPQELDASEVVCELVQQQSGTVDSARRTPRVVADPGSDDDVDFGWLVEGDVPGVAEEGQDTVKAQLAFNPAAQPHISRMAKAEKVRGEAVHRKVVNISSGAGLKGNVGQVNYSSAKAAVIGLTKSLAKEWGRYNVNAVVYGLIRTRLTEALVGGEASIDVEGRKLPVGVNPDLLAQLERGIPLGRAGTPEEAAGAVFLFCLPEANYVSGEVITCGGGW